MVQWHGCKRVASSDQHVENDPPLQATIVKEEQQDDDEAVTAESLMSTDSCKRKRLTLSQLIEPSSKRRAKKKQPTVYYAMHKQIKREDAETCKRKCSMSSKRDNLVERWSLDRYKLAEKNMFEVMKAEGAAIDKPISRTLLRAAARKYIGDTGLLDHLLKHIDGKVAPGGTERFRRCYNTDGIMEYWLESAGLVEIKRASGFPDPNWIPPSWSRSRSVSVQDSKSPVELAMLKEEIAKMKGDMAEMMAKNQSCDRVNKIEEELMKRRISTDQRLMEISSSLSAMQDMFRELVAWKFRAEQQLAEISNSVNAMCGGSKQGTTTFSPTSERWEDWLESTNLDNIQGEDFSWLENTDHVNFGRDASFREVFSAPQSWLKPSDNVFQDHVCVGELDLLKDEVAKMKRDVQELLTKRADDDQAKLTPDSSLTENSKSDNGDSIFQETISDLMKWKAKMEQQLLDISNSVSSLQATKHHIS